MTSIFLMATTKIFLIIFEIVLKNFFCLFFNRKLISVFKQTFREKIIMHAKFSFLCVYNVVLDILILDFFSFSLHSFFFKNA